MIKKTSKDTLNWIEVCDPDSSEIHTLKQQYKLNSEMISYSIDKNERARVEYDAAEHKLIIIYNAVVQRQINEHYETEPITFIVDKTSIISFYSNHTQYLSQLIKTVVNDEKNTTVYGLLFDILFKLSDEYFPLIEEVNRQRIQLTKMLREKTTNTNLLKLSDLELGLVYFLSATKGNTVLLEQLKLLTVARNLPEEEKERLDDVIVETKQAVEMTHIASEILEKLSGTYNNLLNNNLNNNMKFLTVWTLILTVPTIVTGFFGMNVPLPFTHEPLGWGIALLISIFFSLWIAIALWIRKIM
ncbi:magnesium transporter CorA family protein [Vagococcus entomophilus]|uniref:Magnesium transporter CorA n=1 Tax=Vagococcus entomophilus TaxID=1160095 RepID=A0A430AIB5_9ENTE|nr:magnesium transporter CorA family protein [Vagococcus entomophilus]RSU07866.1 magnesium transporter CorA [Vagococcus entomophilus]